MKIIKKGFTGIAVIDPKKKVGEVGQCLKSKGTESNFLEVVAAARVQRYEIRWYYKDLTTLNGEVLPTKIVVTEIPPNHVQPFHTHNNIHELSIVDEGEIMVIDSPSLNEDDREQIIKEGTVLCEGDMVIEDPMVRHTVTNHTSQYARFTTVQVARIPFEKFEADWKR